MTKTEVLKIAPKDMRSIIKKLPTIKNYTWSKSPRGESYYYHHKSFEITDGGKPHLSFRISDHWNFKRKDGSIGCPVMDEKRTINKLMLGLYIDGLYIFAEDDLITTMTDRIDKLYNGIVRPSDKDVAKLVKKYKTMAKIAANEHLNANKKPYTKKVLETAYNYVIKADNDCLKLYKEFDKEYYEYIKDKKPKRFDDIYHDLSQTLSAKDTKLKILDIIKKGSNLN